VALLVSDGYVEKGLVMVLGAHSPAFRPLTRQIVAAHSRCQIQTSVTFFLAVAWICLMQR
jgi:hypothetical protein